MIDLIQEKKEDLKQLCVKYEIARMYVFGSAVSNNFHDQSDIDILISFKEIPFDRYTDNYFNLHAELELLFRRKVDLLTERSLNNKFLIESINQTKELLYAA